jgi:predicted nucleic acid-binding protein
MSGVCLDAGLVVKLVSQEPDSPHAEAAFRKWKTEGIELIAPAFAPAEVDSVLRQKVVRGELNEELGDAAFRLAAQLPIRYDLASDCRVRAWELAVNLGSLRCMTQSIWRWQRFANVSSGQRTANCTTV